METLQQVVKQGFLHCCFQVCLTTAPLFMHYYRLERQVIIQLSTPAAAQPLLELLWGFVCFFVVAVFIYFFLFEFFQSDTSSESGVNLRSGTDPKTGHMAQSLCSCPHRGDAFVVLPFRIVFWIFKTRSQETNLLRNRLCGILIPFYSEGC